MSSPPVLDEKAGRGIENPHNRAAAANEDDPAAALAAALGRRFRESSFSTASPTRSSSSRIARPAMSRSTKRWPGAADSPTSGELIGRRASEVFPAPLGERFEAQDLRVIAEGLSIRGRMELHLYPDGSEGWCLTWKEPLIDASGVIRGLAGISRDAPALSGRAPVSAALSSALAYIDDHLDRAFAHSRSRGARRAFAVPVRSAHPGSVRPLRRAISVAAADRPGLRPAPADRCAVERIGARMRLCGPGGVHPPVP